MEALVAQSTACGKQVMLDADVAEHLNGRSLSIGSHGYVQIWDGHVTLLHRWIMDVARGEGYRVIVDHINGDVLDNRRANLRVTSPTESNLNRTVKGRCAYQVRSGRWQAKVAHQGKVHYLGTFDSSMEAEAAVEAFRAREGIIHMRLAATSMREVST